MPRYVPTAATPIRSKADAYPKNGDPPIRQHVNTFLPMRRHAGTPIRRHIALVLWLAISCLNGSLLPAADAPEKALPLLSEDAKIAAARGLADFRNDNFEDAKSEFQKMTE